MKGVLHGNDLVIRGTILQIGVFPGRLDGALHGLRTAVGKEHPIHSRYLFQLPRRLNGRHIIIIIGGVDQLVDLGL